MKNQLVSIIVPCYNQARYLDICLESVISQTYPDWECIIVNDGSPDNTDEIAQKWCKRDSRFRYFKKENGGVSSARNYGLKIANGDYIQFLDSDDIIANNKFELQLKLLKKNSCDIIISDHAYLINNNQIRNHSICNIDFSPSGLIYGWESSFIFPIHAALISNAFLLNYKIIFSEKLKAEEDYFFWVTCALNNAKFYYHNDILAYYRDHNSGTKNRERLIIHIYKVFLEIYELLDEEQKEIYKDRMPPLLFLKTVPFYTPIVLKKSKAYKIGLFFLFFPKLIKKFMIKILSSLRFFA
ncbi:glycosyltransferase [Treponema sp. TIM-1]|uniref:glycosyltransferase family 2 protein n=1 Tax=Treponema sp. TIM-1 TaxID=2898417 RepID=UPI00398175B5